MRSAAVPDATAPHVRQTDDMHSTDPYYSDSQVTSCHGRALNGARVLPCGAAHHVVTSPAMVRGSRRPLFEAHALFGPGTRPRKRCGCRDDL
jgi:hypothetical protein